MSQIIAFCNDTQNATASRNVFQNMSPFCFLLSTIDTLPVYVRISTQKIPKTLVVFIFYDFFQFLQPLRFIFRFEIFDLERHWSNNMPGNHKIESTSCSIKAVALYDFIATFFNTSPDKFLPPDSADSWKSAVLPAQVHVQTTWRLTFLIEGTDGSSVKAIGIMNVIASRSHSEHQHS
jgi:hypothetical protein